MKIFTKLILILLLTSLLLLSVIYAAVQWSFDRGMLEYVNKKELASLHLLSKNLALFYQQETSWATLVKPNNVDRRPPRRRDGTSAPPPPKRTKLGPSRAWHQILKFSNDGIELPDDVKQYLRINDDFRPRNARATILPPQQRRHYC